MKFNRWWADDPNEKYWLEITDRKDLGIDLRAPQRARNGREKWHYSLINEVQNGDIVFHYGGLPDQQTGICAWSRAVGEAWEELITWAPHAGDSAGEVTSSPGWRIALEGYFPTEGAIVTLNDIRAVEAGLRRIDADLVTRFGKPIYGPFETGQRRIRPVQAYLTKMPRAMVLAFEPLAEVEAQQARSRQPVEATQHRTYRRINETALVSKRDPFFADPALVERGLRAHAQTQNELADYLEWHGIRPLSPMPHEPQFDLAFEVVEVLTVVEVKSITDDNREKQLQLGLGQVLRYAHVLRTGQSSKVRAAVALEKRPPDDWLELLESLSVRVAWPGEWARIL